MARGAEVLLPARRQGAVLPPGLLSGVDPSRALWQGEAFAPLAGVVSPTATSMRRWRWPTTAFTGCRRAPYARYALGLAGGRKVAGRRRYLNDSSAYRADNMPYSGVKASGLGREGPAYAILEMTYPTVVVFNRDEEG